MRVSCKSSLRAFNFVRYENAIVMYHSANVDDSLDSFTASTVSGSPYTIYLERLMWPEAIFTNAVSNNISVDNLSLNKNIYPIFAESDINVINNTYATLQNHLLTDQNSQLFIDEQNRIVYNNFNTHTGEANLGLALSNQQAVSTALQHLEDLGLAPDGEYKATVSYVIRYELTPGSTAMPEPEKIEYTVCFYRTHNGIDMLSDQGDGIVVSFDKYGITNLQYKWRDIRLVENAELMSVCNVTEAQAENVYLSAMAESAQGDTATAALETNTDVVVTAAYLEMDGEMRSVWVCSPDGSYGNHIFVDMQTGEQISI